MRKILHNRSGQSLSLLTLDRHPSVDAGTCLFRAASAPPFSRTVLALFFLLLLSWSNAARAQDPVALAPERGFQPNGSYAISDIESVSLSGGNMNYSLPLASLPAGRSGKLKPTVYLLYNSHLFDTSVRMCLGPSCSFKYTQTDLVPSSFGGWTYGTNYFVLTTNRAINYVDGAPPPQNYYKYKTEIFFPDGSAHQIRPYGQVHDNDYYPVSPGYPGSTTTYYSTDATYFRVQFSTDGASWTIYFPDGSTVNYNNSIGVQTTTDNNGNSYTVQNVTLQNGNPATQVADQLGRKVTIEKPASGPHYVRVNGVGGTELVTTINWGTTSPQGKKYLWKVFHDDGIYQYKTSVYVRPIVTSIDLPNGLNYQFQYNSDVFDPLNPTKSVGWGELYRTTLPTGAVVQYNYTMDNRHGDDTDDIIEPKNIVWDHPSHKQLTYTETYDGVDTQRTDNWSFGISIVQSGPGEGQTSSGTVIGPDGGTTSEYFDVDTSGGPNFNKDGLSYKTVRPDHSVVEHVWQENMPYNGTGKKKNFYIKTDFVSIANAAGALVKTAIKDYTYDKNGNQVQSAEYDWVNYGDVARDVDGRPTGTIPASAQVKRVTTAAFYNATPTAESIAYSPYTYSETTAPNLRKAMASAEVRPGFAGTALSRMELFYDNASTTGNPTQQKSWDSSKAAYSNPLTTGNSISVSSQYDSYGNPTLAIDARGYQTQFIYGPLNGFSGLYPTDIKTALNQTVQRHATREYDFSTGVVTRVTDVDNGVAAATTYDVYGRPTLVKNAEGETEETRPTFEYSDSFQRVIVRSDLNNLGDAKLVTIQHYDQLGRLRLSRKLEDAATQSATDETTGIKAQTRYRYSGSNGYQLVSNPYRAATSGAAGSEATMGWTRTKADNSGRVIAVQTFNGAGLPAPWGGNGSSSGIVATAYDAEFTTVTDQSGKVRRSMADGLGRLARIDEPDSSNNLGTTSAPVQPTQYSYDALANLITVNQGSQTRSFVYSSLSRLTTATNPESGTINYTYDNNGNLLTKRDARAITTTFTYDALNRPGLKNYSDTTPDVAYFYDSQTLPAGAPTFVRGSSRGRLVALTTGGTSAGSYYGYDTLGQTVRRIQRTDSVNYLVDAAYNKAGALATETYPVVPGTSDRRTVSYTFDPAGRLSALSSAATTYAPAASVGAISYAAHGALSSETLGNNLIHALTYNKRLQPTQIKLGTAAAPTSVLNLTYNYGTTTNNGNVLDVTNKIGAWTTKQIYTSDSLNRLDSTQETNGSTTTYWTEDNAYDRYGNRSIVAGGLTFNATNNRITTVGYTYDAVGNLSSDNAHAYNFEAENKISKVDAVSAYTYDGEGQRVRKLIGENLRFIYDMGGKEIAEFDGATGNLKKEYIYGASGLVATIEPTAINANGTRYTTSDSLGSPRVVTNSSAVVISRHDYKPFGEEIGLVGGRTTGMGYSVADGVRQKFTSKERDNETDLNYFLARYYSSSQGRFTSPDVFGSRRRNPQSWNRYSYVLNNPLKYTDPLGLLTQDPQDKTHSLDVIRIVIHDRHSSFLKRILGKIGGLFKGGSRVQTEGEEGEEGESEETREQERKADERDLFEREPWRDPNAIPPVTIEPPMIDPETATELEEDAMTPRLNGETRTEQLKDALNRVAAMEGSPEAKAEMFARYASQITVRSGFEWRASSTRGTDGSHIFIGQQGELLVISPQGQLFRGSARTGLNFGASGLTPLYGNLRLRLPK